MGGLASYGGSGKYFCAFSEYTISVILFSFTGFGGGFPSAPSFGGGFSSAPSFGGGFPSAPSFGGGFGAGVPLPSFGGGVGMCFYTGDCFSLPSVLGIHPYYCC